VDWKYKVVEAQRLAILQQGCVVDLSGTPAIGVGLYQCGAVAGLRP